MANIDFNALNLKLTPIRGGVEIRKLDLWLRNLQEFEHPDSVGTLSFMVSLTPPVPGVLGTTANFEPNFEPTAP